MSKIRDKAEVLERELLADVDEEVEEEAEANGEIEDLGKVRKLEKERARLLSNLLSGDRRHLLTRVAYILNEYPETRNSDLTLQIKYWEVFEDYNPANKTLEFKDLYKLERLTSITRARAKIQNEYGLFRADKRTKRYRRSKEEQEKEAQLADKPSVPTLYIYADESGKTQVYSLVGSVWIADTRRNNHLHPYFIEWKKLKSEEGFSIPKEFHFTDMRRQQLEIYKAFMEEFYRLSDVISFIAVAANNHKIKDKNVNETVFSLYYQVVHLGVEHQILTNRISLPRQVVYFKDAEQGTDGLKMAELEQELKTRFKVYFEDNLCLTHFAPLPSFGNNIIQATDVFTGCVSRIINRTGDERNHKDELAEYVVNLFNIKFIKYNFEELAEIHQGKGQHDKSTVYIFE